MPSLDKPSRPFDVVLFGASGFTGRLVADYLAERAPEGLRWALAGRSRGKLERVRADLTRRKASLASIELLVAESHDAASLARVADEARVICTTVGPYAKHGLPLVAACAERGTDYCDLTGEVPFIRRSIDGFHALAEGTGARIVHACGFDSIPSDLGVFMLHEELKGQGARLARASLYCGPMKGGFSGGTMASMMNFFEEAGRDPSVRRLAGDPYALVPDRDADRGPDRGEQVGVRFDRALGEWTGPFVMATVNTRVVRRTNALLGYPYGRDFRYAEGASFGRGPKGVVRATAMTAGLGAFAALASTEAGRRLLGKKLPAPGEGPSKAERDAGFFRVRILGEGRGEQGRVLSARALVEGKSDPGYGETAKMLGESALCLARDGERLPSRAGVLTPASAMGEALVQRLRRAGMTFRAEVEG